MKYNIKNFFTSGHKFSEFELNLKYRYQIINIGLIISAVIFIYAIIVNIIRDIKVFIPIEGGMLFIVFILMFLLRKYRFMIKYVAVIMTAQFLFLFLYLIYYGYPDDLKHIWVIVFPAILLYFQPSKRIFCWLFAMIFLILMAPLQTIIEVQYSMYQVSYIVFVLVIESVLIHFYQLKMDESQKLILEQQKMLLDFNSELEKQVKEKTSELTELNESLEKKVAHKLEELTKKDKILETQSKQAVMGEMISMIAHQWRQPLSTITLQIANLQLDKLLGKEVSSEDTDGALSNISDTIVYLSETIDDFLTYFNNDKELVEVEVHELLQKALNFAMPRVKGKGIEIVIDKKADIYIKTYINEFIQVVLNILNNAIDAVDESKNDKPYINISIKSKDDFILLDISDNAGGISSENIPNLFEPYFSTKGKNGTGLGLYMSQMIVQKQFNGNIDVISSENGSTFTIKVPKDIS
ncbi:HAMP domain-containing histidine kinase [Candidatus Sulfurimonas marisnigri]|uniref:histidine kinase n=1 Tax=Candidatus Sulfurimonas marisnigri TaxID=2740405 RepID=A0A7S7RR27_9BACT|nr:HAMP domain-containing sensor histidine kinase [Candidatus Sulfurimonas marisnigri]QOY55065.1 HAMP domain-containing histidine kinase [Candidatus Sulfurimonas marisnigri]